VENTTTMGCYPRKTTTTTTTTTLVNYVFELISLLAISGN
jgi:hypothetical protein